MAGYIGSRAVSVNTTSATITDDLTIGDDLTVTDDMTVGGTLGVTGVLTATSLDISGDIDVDGTTNLDVVDIDGAVDMASTLDVSGNLGIGTTATTAASSTKNIFLGGTGNIYADAAASADASLSISQNAKVDADNSWEYIVTDEASNYYQNAGYHVWRYAASGSAGADISWSEAMRIDSGRLLIGTTSTYFADADDLVVAGSGNQGITIASGTSNAGNIFFADGTSGDDRFRGIVRYDHSGNNMLFYTNGANERMRIDSSGNVLVGKSSVSFGTAGAELNPSGSHNMTRSGGASLSLNRLSSDGNILDFYKDGTGVGSINSRAGVVTTIILDPRSGGGGLSGGGQTIFPTDNGGTLADDRISFGSSSLRFDDIFATNGTIQTSDQNEKQDIAALTSAEMLVAKRISALFKTFRWKSKVAAKGDDARTHSGIVAQDVQAAFAAESLDAGDYGMFISTTWTNDDGDEQTRMGIRYPELLSFLAAYNEQRFAAIETRLTALEG
jgi:cytoskeletal protein CcmA (bactofilin family)